MIVLKDNTTALTPIQLNSTVNAVLGWKRHLMMDELHHATENSFFFCVFQAFPILNVCSTKPTATKLNDKVFYIIVDNSLR